jgi:chemotaxis protein histidine kinase CheA
VPEQENARLARPDSEDTHRVYCRCVVCGDEAPEMDELLRDFLTETGENLDRVDAQLVRLEHEPNNAHILGNIFRLVHTIKGTCGFLGLPRLEELTHAAETLMANFGTACRSLAKL